MKRPARFGIPRKELVLTDEELRDIERPVLFVWGARGCLRRARDRQARERNMLVGHG